MPNARICPHNKPTSRCKPCFKKYHRQTMAYYRANPDRPKCYNIKPCIHGFKLKKSCIVCLKETSRLRGIRYRQTIALRQKGIVLVPFERFDPILEMLI